jgi:hypothetical protein
MRASTDVQAESSCCGREGAADYFEVARKLALAGSARMALEAVEVEDANVVEVDAQMLSQSGTLSVEINLDGSEDAHNWIQLNATSPLIRLSRIGASQAAVSSVSSRFVRTRVASGGTGSSRVSVGIRLRTEPPILMKPVESPLPGLLVPRAGEEDAYFLLADRLSVAQASSATLPPVSMADFNAVRLEIVVIQTTSGLTIGADIEGSNDAQTWETLQSNTGIGFGYSSPSTLFDVSHRFVRVKVTGPQAFGPAELALGLYLSRQSR